MYSFIAVLLTLLIVLLVIFTKPKYKNNPILFSLFIGVIVFTLGMWVNIVLPDAEKLVTIVVTIAFCTIFLWWIYIILIPRKWKNEIEDFVIEILDK